MSSPIDKVDDSVLQESLIIGAKDGFVAAALTTIFIMATSKRIPMIGALTPQAKFATVSVVSLATAVIGTEHSMYRYYRPYLLAQQAKRGVGLSWPERIYAYRYPLVVGTFVATLVGGLMATAGDVRRSGPQRFMAMRLYAQAAGFAVLFGTIGLGVLAGRARMERERAVDGTVDTIDSHE